MPPRSMPVGSRWDSRKPGDEATTRSIAPRARRSLVCWTRRRDSSRRCNACGECSNQAPRSPSAAQARRPRLARRAPRRPLRQRIRLGPALRAAGGADRRRLRPRDRPSWIAARRPHQSRCRPVRPRDETTAKLRTLLVEPEARGLGLGRRLVKRSSSTRKQRGDETLTLWTNDILSPPGGSTRRRLRPPARGPQPRLRPRPHRTDLVP